jgi:hypothetical protein
MYRLEDIQVLVRETAPARSVFLRGRQDPSKSPPEKKPHPIGFVRLPIADDEGRSTFGCAGDYLSVNWLDKRKRPEAEKMKGLAALLEESARIYREHSPFETPFQLWRGCYDKVQAAGENLGEERLMSTFASAMVERAVLDGVCRLQSKPIFKAFHEDFLGFDPVQVHPELSGFDWKSSFRDSPKTSFYLRHTVGLGDPLTLADLNETNRVGDGEPETLEEYIRRDGVHYFKIKVSGRPDWDFERLKNIWGVLPKSMQAGITIDANESYRDLESLQEFVGRLKTDLSGFYQHLLYLEQPVPRALTFDPTVEPAIRKMTESLPVIIDEADATVNSYKEAVALGYTGVSHKNCKGFFKSLLNHCLTAWYRANGKETFMSAEDLMQVPIVPLHQDFASLGILGIEHCERNGHHYNYNLSMLTESEKAVVAKNHGDLYEERNGHRFLRVVDGQVECGSLQCPGFGVSGEPDWGSMTRVSNGP